MGQETFELWHAGKRNPRGTRTSTDVDLEMFVELDHEAPVLNKLLADGNAWEAYCRVNSWLHALNKFVTWYRGETGVRRADLETQQVMAMFLRWIGDNRELISSIVAGVGGSYHSITVSPGGIMLSVSFGSRSQAGPEAGSAAGEILPQMAGEGQSQSPQPQPGAPAPGVAGSAPPHPGPSPSDTHSSAFNPNGPASVAAANNSAGPPNPTRIPYRYLNGRR